MSKINVSTTGYNSNTPNSYVLDAGAIFINVNWDSASNTFKADKRLGATSGGNEFTVEQKYRTVEVDGVKTDAVGQKIFESETASLKTNLKELTAENLKLAINGKVTNNTVTGYDLVESKGELTNADYISNIAYVGKLSGSNKPVVIVLYNALSTEGLSFKTEDNNEVVIPVTFVAHQDAANVEEVKANYKIYFPKVSVSQLETKITE